MNTTHIRLFTIMLFLIIGISCDQITSSSNNDKIPVPFAILCEVPSIGDYVTTCRINIQNIEFGNNNGDLSDIELIITDEENFNNYLICEDNSDEINFLDHFILAGMTKLNPTSLYIKDQVVYILRDTLYYSVEILDGDATMPTRGEYIVLVSSEYLDYPIKFKVFFVEVEV